VKVNTVDEFLFMYENKIVTTVEIFLRKGGGEDEGGHGEGKSNLDILKEHL
jgi:hypothetical protein